MKKFNSLSDLSVLKNAFKTEEKKVETNKVESRPKVSTRYFIDPITKMLVTEKL